MQILISLKSSTELLIDISELSCSDKYMVLNLLTKKSVGVEKDYAKNITGEEYTENKYDIEIKISDKFNVTPSNHTIQTDEDKDTLLINNG